MLVLIASTLLSLVVLPLAALYWLTRRSGSLAGWGLKALAVGGYVWATFGLGGWQMLSYYGRYVLLLLAAWAALLGAWRMVGAPVWSMPRGRQWVGHGVAVLLLVASGWALAGMHRGQEVPPDPVTLSSPLRDGTFYVASGGSHSLVNPHMKVAAPDLQDWRGQLWAVDFVELYPAGTRARGLYPTTLSDFAIYGTPVYAPCDGRVEAVTDTLPDLVPPARDTARKAGNYVLLRCGPEAYVMLAHLKQGSVDVDSGDSVATGARLGAIGNSGNSWEPHLHLNAQRGPGARTVLDADPRPMVLDGRFLVRNDVIRARPRPPEDTASARSPENPPF